MNAPACVSVSVRQRFPVRPEEVFAAWLDPQWIGRWMFGPAVREEEVVRLFLEARVGGSFSFLVRRQGTEIDHIGEYLEIVRPRRLVFTWAVRGTPDTSRVVVEIDPQETGCELNLTHELHPHWGDYADRVKESWTTMLGGLGTAFPASIILAPEPK